MERRHTPGPWEYVPSNENHGPYVSNGWGAGDICDCYIMSKPSELSVCNGGASKPIHMQHDEADANAMLIAAAPDLLDVAKRLDAWWTESFPEGPDGDPVWAGGLGNLSDDTLEIWRAFRAAIAKAETRS